MKVLKRILKTILWILLAIVGIGFLMPGQTHIERAMAIDAPAAVVFGQIDTLRYWEAWSPWAKIDPQASWQYSEKPAGVGAYYTWSGNRSVGSGKVTVQAVKPNEDISYLMEFGGQGPSVGGFKLTATDSTHTQLTWHFDTEHGPNPFARLIGLLMPYFIGKDYEKGLLQLKDHTEQLYKKASY